MGLGMMLTVIGGVMAIWGLRGLRMSSCTHCGAAGAMELRTLDSDDQMASIVETSSIRRCAACGASTHETTRHLATGTKRGYGLPAKAASLPGAQRVAALRMLLGQ